MAEENPSTVNIDQFDLNLAPLDNSSDDSEPISGSSYPNVAMNLEDWLDGPVHVHRIRQVVRHRNRTWQSWWRQVPISPQTRAFELELIGGNAQQTGEGSDANEERPTELEKMCECGIGYREDEARGKKDDAGKDNGEEGSFFDCNICLDLAKDPVVTCCGHLFCWPCLYQWLHHHSDAKECPVCKGEVTIKNVTPIYGRGSNMQKPDVDCSLKIPARPQARRIDSWRQTIQRSAFSIPMEGTIRHIERTFDLGRELDRMQSQILNGPYESPERSDLLPNRILTSRGLRRERTLELPSDDVIDVEISPSNYDARDNRRFSSLLLSRSNSLGESLAAERLVESYFHINPMERNEELPPPVDDRDSMSSIAAVIHSGSQTVDNAIEIDSRVSLSTSSSRRRNDASRISDVDSGDSRAPRRRRLR